MPGRPIRAIVRIVITRMAVTLASSLLALGLTGTAASASTDIAGPWITDSLRDNRIGYALTLRPAPDGDYTGSLRFVRQDGREEGRRAVTATLSGSTVTLRSASGSFDRSAGALLGTLSDDGRSITLTNCQARLRLVMARDLASDCTLLRPPRR